MGPISCTAGMPGLSRVSVFLGVNEFCSLSLTPPGRQHGAEVSSCGQIPHGVGVNMGGPRRDGQLQVGK